ncbi:hypothetical protein EXU57_04760 [Segetibacter sp. 3557_3]|uniref:pentapeptide repeat-containing protein n=1 Tax=Segetibacter sp. 3557_3 TaxID=2547429 RepID=UPI001058D827|nr:pentapeptide repeat-containing protein [Segetibacter sp. 3557_3]TDH27787.1 hypothetical protein EXU57_04760 [Segetibacter sp. 3557_3]
MKYYFLGFLILLVTFCASKKDTQTQNKGDMKESLRTGKDIFIENRVFTEELDITKLLDPNLVSDGIYQVKTSSSVTFKNCRFEGKVKAFSNQQDSRVTSTAFLSNVSFIQCIFNNEVNFRSSSIMGTADFTKSTFNKVANFEECTFLQNAYFNGCTFNDDVRFQNAFFTKRANLMNTQFNKASSFQNTTFNSEVQFSVGKFRDYADFSLSKFNDNAFFNYCDFSKNASFNSSHFSRGVDFLNVNFNNTEFKGCSFYGDTRFFQSAVQSKMDFENTFFLFGTPDLSFIAAQKVNLANLKKIRH